MTSSCANATEPRHAETAAAAEQTIADAIPEIVEKLVSMAKEGHVPAARYLMDRIMGKISSRVASPLEEFSTGEPPVDKSTQRTREQWAAVCFPEEQRRTVVGRALNTIMPGIGRSKNSIPLIAAIEKELHRRGALDELALAVSAG